MRMNTNELNNITKKPKLSVKNNKKLEKTCSSIGEIYLSPAPPPWISNLLNLLLCSTLIFILSSNELIGFKRGQDGIYIEKGVNSIYLSYIRYLSLLFPIENLKSFIYFVLYSILCGLLSTCLLVLSEKSRKFFLGKYEIPNIFIKITKILLIHLDCFLGFFLPLLIKTLFWRESMVEITVPGNGQEVTTGSSFINRGSLGLEKKIVLRVHPLITNQIEILSLEHFGILFFAFLLTLLLILIITKESTLSKGIGIPTPYFPSSRSKTNFPYRTLLILSLTMPFAVEKWVVEYNQIMYATIFSGSILAGLLEYIQQTSYDWDRHKIKIRKVKQIF